MSASLWDGPTVTVQGLPWCKDAPKTIGIANLTAKILCRSHNAALSDVDQVGGSAFKTLEGIVDLHEKRRQMRPRRWKVARFEVDGLRLERWFLKTLINICVSNPDSGTWALSRTPYGQPPRTLIDAAFGVTPLKKPLGLYATGALGENINFTRSLEVQTLLAQDGALIGAVLSFLGWRFLLALIDVDVPKSVSLPASKGWIDGSALFHVAKFNMEVHGKLSHYVHFLWNIA